MHKEICKVRQLEKGVLLKVGDEVLLVRGEQSEPETFVITVICPKSPPIGKSMETGITRVLSPLAQDERFFVIERAA